ARAATRKYAKTQNRLQASIRRRLRAHPAPAGQNLSTPPRHGAHREPGV
ncbi:MAG: hypothetical protein AVDCRST_MAG78-2589, partial [uncultured Rubrobacteraceae bacterium]